MVSSAEAVVEEAKRPLKLDVRDLSIYYADTPALENVTLDVNLSPGRFVYLFFKKSNCTIPFLVSTNASWKLTCFQLWED